MLFTKYILVEAKVQEMTWVLRWMTRLDEVPTKLHQVIRLSECWLLLSLCLFVCLQNGDFPAYAALRKLIQVPRQKFKDRGSCPEKKETQKKEISLCPKDCGTDRVDCETFLAQLWIQDVPCISIVLYESLYCEKKNNVGLWKKNERMRCQNLPFMEHMKSTGLYYKTEEQENALTPELNAYYEVFYKACISENIK